MNANGTTQERKVIPFSPTGHHSIYSASTSKKRMTTTTTTATATVARGFCRRLSDCIVMGPATSRRTNRPAAKICQLAHVEEMEKELEKQKELKSMYKTKLERTQGFLKHCLQVAQDNGFLNLIVNKDDKDQEFSLSPTITNSNISLQLPPSAQSHSDLVALINQAKINGWYIDPQEIEMHHLSAQGTTADIYRGRWRGLDVAIKCMYPDFFQSNENGVSFFAQEVETLSRQHHPFVLQLIGACFEPPENCWIVTEFLGMNLKEWLHGSEKRQKERTIPLPPFKDRVEKALEIAQAMQYLHGSKPKILHRDLKPSNIFLDDALHVRVADFGHARFLTDGEKALTGETGTFVYMAPEVISCCPYDEKCDVYSFGVILNELMTGEHPYIDTDYGPSKIALEVAENGLRPRVAKAEQQLEELIIELIQQLWDQEPAARPSFNQITFSLRNIHNQLSNCNS